MLFFQAEDTGSGFPLRQSSSAVRNLSGELDASDVERSGNLDQVKSLGGIFYLKIFYFLVGANFKFA